MGRDHIGRSHLRPCHHHICYWRDDTVKLLRNFTHERETLSTADEKVFKEGMEPLRTSEKLGALLIQFPYSFYLNETNWQYVQELADALYDYLYNEFEIFELTERVRQIAKEAEEFNVITNNHYRGQAISNALEIKAKLEGKRIKIPEIILPHYTQLKELQEEKII